MLQGSGSPIQKPCKPRRRSNDGMPRQTKHAINTGAYARRSRLDGSHDRRRCVWKGNYRMDKISMRWFAWIFSVTLLASLVSCGKSPSTEADIDFPGALRQSAGDREA